MKKTRKANVAAKQKPSTEDGGEMLARKQAFASRLQAQIDDVQLVLEKIQRWPSVPELAHLAAALKRGGTKAKAQALVAEAWEVWESSYGHLHSKLEGRIAALGSDLAFGLMAEWVPGISPRVCFHDGKAEFETGLKGLVGAKTRRAERYAIFREFLRHQIREKTKLTDEAAILTKTEMQFAESKRGGFREGGFLRFQESFDKWRGEWRRERATNAAKERWKDDEEQAAAQSETAATEAEKP